ncbi:MAG: hypothetical protein ABI614_11475 [Planctomycetota bacterium]
MKLFSRSRRNNHRLRRQRRLLFEPLCHRTLLAVDLVPGSSSASFVDMGFNPDTGEVVLVGTEDSGVAKVFKLNAARTAISSETLVGLGLDTQVLGISSDGTRIAGVSKSPESVDVGEGTTWLSSAPDSPVGIGFVSGKPKTSTALGAWNGGCCW